MVLWRGLEGSSAQYDSSALVQAAAEYIDDLAPVGRVVRACFGTTKYCNAFLKGIPCNNGDCLYLHAVGALLLV